MKQFLLAIACLTAFLFVTQSTKAQEYRIKVKATGQYLHEDGGGDKLVSTRYQANDDFTVFIFESQADGDYRIKVKATGQYLHENGNGDKLVSTRWQPNDEFTRFVLFPMADGSKRIRAVGSGRYLHEDGGGDKLVSTRYQPTDDFTKFILEPIAREVPVKIRFVNRTKYQISIFGGTTEQEKHYRTLEANSEYTQPTSGALRWRVKYSDAIVGIYLANNAPAQTVQVLLDPVEAGPIQNSAEANPICLALAGNKRMLWTGAWWTTVQGSMSVCEMLKTDPPY